MLRWIKYIKGTLILCFFIQSNVCFAHVKWFSPYDLSTAPVALNHLLSSQFFIILCLSLVMIFTAYVLDGYWSDSQANWAISKLPLSKFNASYDPTNVLRIATGIFFVVVAMYGGIILTPELKTEMRWVPLLQISMAILLLFRRTLCLTGLGIIALYLYAISQYGLFHLMDYVVFLGLAAYLIFSSSNRHSLLRLRLPALYIGVSVTLLWAAMEKFLYPQWSMPLMEQHSSITFGIEPNLYICIAGFVEFVLAFMLLTGRMLKIVAAVVLTLMFVLAIAEFGKIDAVGHLPIIAALIIMQAEEQQPYVISWFQKRSILVNAGYITLIYVAFLVLFFALYYGLYLSIGVK